MKRRRRSTKVPLAVKGNKTKNPLWIPRLVPTPTSHTPMPCRVISVVTWLGHFFVEHKDKHDTVECHNSILG